MLVIHDRARCHISHMHVDILSRNSEHVGNSRSCETSHMTNHIWILYRRSASIGNSRSCEMSHMTYHILWILYRILVPFLVRDVCLPCFHLSPTTHEMHLRVLIAIHIVLLFFLLRDFPVQKATARTPLGAQAAERTPHGAADRCRAVQLYPVQSNSRRRLSQVA